MNEKSGQSFAISVDSTTAFEDFDRTGCTASPEDFSCLKMGQILDIDLSENGMSKMLAKRVEFEEDANREALKGTVTSVDSSNQFHMVVFNEEPALSGVSEGSQVTVTIQPTAMFQIGREEMGESGGFSIPGLSFARGADLLVGQGVQIPPRTVSSGGGGPTIATDLLRLWAAHIPAQGGSSG